MHTREARHRAILELVTRRTVGTQAALKALLDAKGITADQATLSRDIRELGLVRVRGPEGRYRYATVETLSPPPQPRAASIIARLVRSAEAAGNLVVVKTDAGQASPVALALDRMTWPEIAGTVAGDDTLIIVVRTGKRADRVAMKVLELKKRGGERGA